MVFMFEFCDWGSSAKNACQQTRASDLWMLQKSKLKLGSSCHDFEMTG